MRVAVFSAKGYDREHINRANRAYEDGCTHTFAFFEAHLEETTVVLAHGFDAVCVFVNDRLSRSVLESLRESGVRLIALRCAGFNNVDLAAAKELGLLVARVP